MSTKSIRSASKSIRSGSIGHRSHRRNDNLFFYWNDADFSQVTLNEIPQTTDTEIQRLEAATHPRPFSPPLPPLPPSHRVSSSVEELKRTAKEEGIDHGLKGPPRATIAKHLCAVITLLLVLFWSTSSWLFGKMYQQEEHFYKLHILAVDFDGGPVGQAMLDIITAQDPHNHRMATFDIIHFNSGETFHDVWETVRAGNAVWGALIANSGASKNLSDAITLQEPNAPPYDPSTALTILFNDVRYHTVALSLIQSSLTELVANISVQYQMKTGLPMLTNLSSNATDGNKAALLTPIASTVNNMSGLSFGTSVLVNTVMFVLPVLSQFFLVMATNGMLGEAGCYSLWPLKDNLILRAILAVCYPCLIGMSWAGWIYIWKDGNEGSHLGTGQFFLTWLTMWLYAAIHFNVIDGTASLVHLRWMSFFMLTILLTQVAATVGPHELANRFYKIDYLLPAFHIWGILMTIFSGGANNHLKVNLTIALLWLPVAVSYNIFGQIRRWKLAHAAAAADPSKAFQKMVPDP